MKKPDYERLAFLILEILYENDGKREVSEIMKDLDTSEGEKIHPDFKVPTEKNRYPKWQNSLQGFVDIFVKAEYIRKKGTWYLLPKGEAAFKKGQEFAISEAKAARKSWLADRKKEQSVDVDEAEGVDVDDEAINLDRYRSDAITSIKEYIHSLDPYAFQDLCAALLRGMGYHVRDVASPGPDGGVDIVVYNDPLGSQPPRIKVQVKHYTTVSKVNSQEVNNLAGSLREGEIGVLMTSSSFTRDCGQIARLHPKHIDLIDYDRFIELWVKHYDELSTKDKSLLPIQPIYFLNREES